MNQRNYFVVSAASGWGAQVRQCQDGPEALRQGGCLEKLRIQQIPIVDWDTVHPLVQFQERDIALPDALPLIIDFNQRLADHVSGVMQRGFSPVILGGDHSIAIGTWNGVAKHLAAEKKGPLGLIWIDAHMDAHTPETTPSGAWHGMPVAALLGYGDPSLTKLKRQEPILLPENLCLVGVHSFEKEELELLNRLGVKIYRVDEVKKRGIQQVLQEAVAHVTKHTKQYGVSFDLDVIDPTEAPGVGSPEPGGLLSQELIAALPIIGSDPRLIGFELVEFNPSRDQEKKTFSLCCRILEAVLLARASNR